MILRLLLLLILCVIPSLQFVPISQKGCVSDPADVVFLLDRSGSVGLQPFQTELKFIAEFAKHYVIGPNNVQIGIVTFSGSTTKEFDLNSFHDINELESQVMKIRYHHDGTHTSTALQFVRENSFTAAAGDRPNVKNFLIVITDGQSRPAKFNPAEEAKKIHRDTNIEVFAIGVGRGISMNELQVIATNNNHVMTITDHLDLHLPLRQIRCEQFRNTTVVPSETTTNMLSTTTVPSTTQEPSTTVATTTQKRFVECMGCKGIPEPHDCKETILCAEHEQCSTEFYITPAGNVFYDLGCSANRVCDAISNYGRQGRKAEHKRQNENVYICQECCNSEHCNRFGCSDKEKLNRTVCYSCLDVAHPGDCDTVSICDIDKQCYARHFINDMFEERWTLGCEEKQKCSDVAKYSSFIGHPKSNRQIGGFDAFDICYYCCGDNFCNKNDCIKGLLSQPKNRSTSPALDYLSTKNVYTNASTTDMPLLTISNNVTYNESTTKIDPQTSFSTSPMKILKPTLAK